MINLFLIESETLMIQFECCRFNKFAKFPSMKGSHFCR